MWDSSYLSGNDLLFYFTDWFIYNNIVVLSYKSTDLIIFYKQMVAY